VRVCWVNPNLVLLFVFLSTMTLPDSPKYQTLTNIRDPPLNTHSCPTHKPQTLQHTKPTRELLPFTLHTKPCPIHEAIPQTLNPQPSTLHLSPSTCHPQPSLCHSQHLTPRLLHHSVYPPPDLHKTQTLKPQTLKPQTLKPQTLKPQSTFCRTSSATAPIRRPTSASSVLRSTPAASNSRAALALSVVASSGSAGTYGSRFTVNG
jgi:hypothetical protein